jgi:5-methylcytosine-specific restriction endonuclease McrA
MKRSNSMRRRARSRGGLTAFERGELDAMHREVVMLRAGAYLFPEGGWMGACAKCGKTRWLQVSHIEPKGRVPSLRWDADNAIALCAPCHLFWWHKWPREAEEWVVFFLGRAARDRLKVRARAGGAVDYHATKLALVAARIRASQDRRAT